MSRFAPALRELARALDLPREARAAIVRELAADLDALYAHHRAQGVEERTAHRMAEEAVLGSSEVVRRLARLHRGSWQRWSESLGSQLGRGMPLVMLLLGVVPMLGAAAVLAATALAGGGGALAWGVAVVGVAMAATIGRGAFVLLVREEARRRGLALLPVLASLAGALGLLAGAFGLQAALSALAAGVPDAAARVQLARALGHAAGVAATGLLLAIAGVFAWFILVGRRAAQLAREVDALLAAEASPVRPGGATILQLDRGRSA